MIKSNKNKISSLILSTFLISQVSCALPAKILEITPSQTPKSIKESISPNSNLVPNKQLEPNTSTTITSKEQSSNTVGTTIIPIIFGSSKIKVTSFNSTQGKFGEKITIQGVNFVSGKIKKINFKSLNISEDAIISNISESELSFSIPTFNSISTTRDFSVSLILENSEVINIGSFKVLLNDSTSTFIGNTNSGSSNTFTPISQPIQTPQPLQTQAPIVNKGLVSGIVKDRNQVVISNATVNIYNSLGVLLETGLTKSDGTYSINVVEGSNYYLEFVKTGYLNFRYYMTKNVVLSQINTIENVYQTLETIGSGTLKGSITALTLADVVGSFVYVYDENNLLIANGLVNQSGAYSFFVPTGSKLKYKIVKPNYLDFWYYDLSITSGGIINIDPFYMNLASAITTNVSGLLKDASNSNLITGISYVRIYNKLGQIVWIGLTDTNGNYNFSVPIGSDYYIKIVRTGFLDLYYYGLNLIANQVFSVENLFLSNVSIGLGSVSGIVDLSTVAVGSVVRVYNKLGILITTGWVLADGTYNFPVPVGSDYYIKIIRTGYTDFYYYGLNVFLNTSFSISERFALALSNLGTEFFTGVYLDAVTNKPVANTVIRIYNSSGYVIASGLTDYLGNYKFYVPVGINYSYRYWYYYNNLYSFYNTYYGLNINFGSTYYAPSNYYIDPLYQKPGDIAGSIIDSLTGTRVQGLTLKLKDSAGTVIATTTTGAKGSYSFLSLPAGYYNLETSGNGYYTNNRSVYILGGRPVADQNIYVSPSLAVGQTRVVLYWGASPQDLDLHATGPDTTGARIHVYDGGTPISQDITIDRNSFTGYGPEVITIKNPANGMYRFSVHDFSNKATTSTTPSFALQYSGATVYVYNSSGFVNGFYVPSNTTGGNLWTVFELNGNTVTPINTMSYINDGFNIQSLGNITDSKIIKRDLKRK